MFHAVWWKFVQLQYFDQFRDTTFLKYKYEFLSKSLFEVIICGFVR